MDGYILVLGDNIADDTRICKATRLCPEAPVPVLVETERYTTAGGAGLVAAQLEEFLGENHVQYVPLSHSIKERLFADNHLIVRVDKDNAEKFVWTDIIKNDIAKRICGARAVVVSDYGKGGIPDDGDWHPSSEIASMIIETAQHNEVPTFIDAKKRWNLYCGATMMFPNEHEANGHMGACCSYTIQKLGPRGCAINESLVPQTLVHRIVDTTGAGDIFIAAFVAKYLNWKDDGSPWHGQLHLAAKFANYAAGKSVEWVGTHVVKGLDVNLNSW